MAPRAKRGVSRRLQNFFDKAESANLLTEAAVQSVLNLVDPFPDSSLDPVGWPSVSAGNTVPLVSTQFLDLSAPSGVEAAGYNMKVIFIPVTGRLVSTGVSTFNSATGDVSDFNTTAGEMGQFNVYRWLPGQDEPDPVSVDPDYVLNCDIDSGGSNARICAAGFELINTSSELYRGGMQYGFRTPLITEDFSPGGASAVTTNSMIRYKMLSGVPSTLKDIINLNTTFSGSAENGIGVFSLPMEASNPPAPALPIKLALSAVQDAPLTKNWVREFSSAYGVKPFEWQVCGGYVTGQSPSATFTLKARVFYEVIPTSRSGTLIQAVARTPVPYSYIIEEMLANLLRTMPSSFDYSENPLGEWFDKMLAGLAGVIPAIGTFFPHPVVKAIAAGAGPVIAGLQEYRKKKAVKKKLTQTSATKPAQHKGRKVLSRSR